MKACVSLSLCSVHCPQGSGRLRRLYYAGRLATIRLVEIPEPALPSADWVKIKTLLCGLCART